MSLGYLLPGAPPREASAFERGARSAAEWIAPPQRSPSEALRDMRLPQSALDILTHPLLDLGLSVGDKTVRPRYGSSQHTFTVIGNGGLELFLLHIEGWILDNPTDSKYNALAALPFAFEEGTSLLVLSEALNVIPAIPYRNMIAERWPQKHHLQAIFVPWIDILKLQTLRADHDRARRHLRDVLHLEEWPGPGPGASSVLDMSPEEKQELRRILAGLPDFQDVRGRSVMADLAGLKGVLSGFDFTGNPGTVAGALIIQLQTYGEVSEGRHALGMLLSYLSGLPDTPPATVAFMKDVIRKYRLVPD